MALLLLRAFPIWLTKGSPPSPAGAEGSGQPAKSSPGTETWGHAERWGTEDPHVQAPRQRINQCSSNWDGKHPHREGFQLRPSSLPFLPPSPSSSLLRESNREKGTPGINSGSLNLCPKGPKAPRQWISLGAHRGQELWVKMESCPSPKSFPP